MTLQPDRIAALLGLPFVGVQVIDRAIFIREQIEVKRESAPDQKPDIDIPFGVPFDEDRSIALAQEQVVEVLEGFKSTDFGQHQHIGVDLFQGSGQVTAFSQAFVFVDRGGESLPLCFVQLRNVFGNPVKEQEEILRVEKTELEVSAIWPHDVRLL